MGKKKGDKIMKKIVIALVLILSLVVVSASFAKDFFGEERTYIVKKGDKPLDIIVSLAILSRTTPNKVKEWNPDLGLHNIQIGQKIRYYVKDEDGEKSKDKTIKYVLFEIIVLSVFIFLLSVILFFTAKRMLKNQYQQKTSFPVIINEEEYLYTPEKIGNDFISLFRGLRYKIAQDAFKSSKKILQNLLSAKNKEISAGRLKPKI